MENGWRTDTGTLIRLMNCYPADDIDKDFSTGEAFVLMLSIVSLWICCISISNALCGLHCNQRHDCWSLHNKMINISIQFNLFETENRHRFFEIHFFFCHISMPFAVFVRFVSFIPFHLLFYVLSSNKC